MKKSILKLLIIITITSLTLFSFAGCKSPETTDLEERIEKLELEEKIEALEDELAKKEAEETSPEEEEKEVTEETNETEEMEEEEDGEEEIDDADSDTDADADSDTDADKEAPTISLTIYEGPTLDGSICYYRIQATVIGSSTVSFSKDDSGGAWGSKKVQINLNNPTDTYTLTATASNSEGSATDSIALSWGCAIPTPDPIEKDVDIGIFINESGFAIEDGALNFGDPLAWLGDWDNNKRVFIYLTFGIGNISALDDVTIKDVSVTIPVVGKVNQPEQLGKILVYVEDMLVKTLYNSPSLNNLDFSSNNLENALQKAVDADEQGFSMSMGFVDVSTNNVKDYYRIHVYSVALHVKYEIPG